LAFTVTFPAAPRCPASDEIAAWLTTQGEPFEEEGPHTLQLRALPVRIVIVSEERGFQAHIDVTTSVPLVRLVELIFELSNRAGTDVRLAGAGQVTRAGLWLRLADEQDRRRVARALERAREQGKGEEVVRGLWAVLAAACPERDVRWDVSRERVVELKEVGAPGGIPLEEAAFHMEEASAGDVVAVEIGEHLHLVAWRWLSEAHPGLSDL
jgi:hypothetical protein